MSSLYLPNPCLLGIILCISTHDGNQLVFHYPPNAKANNYKSAVPASRRKNSSTVTDNDDAASASEDDTDSVSSEEEEEEEDDDDNDGVGYYDNRNYGNSSYGSKANGDPLSLASGSTIGGPGSQATGNGSITAAAAAASAAFGASRTSERASLKSNDGAGLMSMRTNDSSLLQSKTGSIGSSPVVSASESEKHLQSKLFGFDINFLSDTISPPKALCNTRFELTVEDTAFLGLPIRIGEDGNWRPTKHRHHHKKHKSKHRSHASETGTTGTGNNEENSSDDDDNNEADHQEEQQDCPMYMFHLVFVMNPPVDEYNYRIDEMYHYVVSRLTLLLRYEQQKSDYVWSESQKIIQLSEEAAGMSRSRRSQFIVERSQLANVIKQAYEGLSNSDIVNLEINGKFSSFQIPIRTEFNAIPPKYVKVLAGSSLSSISPFDDTGDPVFRSTSSGLEDSSTWMVYFALLLLDDPETIIKDIKAEKDSVIANFVRMIKPSESLARLSALSGLEISEVKLFASHLIYWRRAKATLPLAPRNIYIVSPLAPLDRLYADSLQFKQAFPALPPLAQLLSMISSNSNRPRPVSTIIPSRDHRDLYMDAVSWLLKHGYLTQMYTFVWLRISKDIKIKVAEEIETERKKRRQKKQGAEESNATPSANASGTDSGDNSEREGGGQQKTSSGAAGGTDNTAGIREADNHVHREGSPMQTGSGASGSVESNGSSKKPNAMKQMVQFEEEEEEDTILTDPESSTALERRWIAKCVEGKPGEVINLFYKLLKYMNGKHPLELFILKENVSRQDVRKLLSSMGPEIVTIRHW